MLRVEDKVNAYSLHWEEDAVALGNGVFMHGARIECRKEMLQRCVDYLFARLGRVRVPTRRCYHETRTESTIPLDMVYIRYITLHNGQLVVPYWTDLATMKEHVLFRDQKIDHLLSDKQAD